jgi:hypothetical protein
MLDVLSITNSAMCRSAEEKAQLKNGGAAEE